MLNKDLFARLLAGCLAFSFSVPVAAGSFALDSISFEDLEDMTAAAPLPDNFSGIDKSPNLPSPVLDLSLKLPFSVMNGLLTDRKDSQFAAVSPELPVLMKDGEYVAFRNVFVRYNGIEAEPDILLKPVFEGPNRISIKVAKVVLDVSFGPKSLEMPDMNKNAVMETAINSVTRAVVAAMDRALAKNKVPLKAADVLTFSYDRLSWTLSAAVSPGFVAPLLPGLIENITLNSFSFDESGFALGVHSGPAAARLKDHNLMMSDGLLTNFLARHARGSDFDPLPEGRDGGVKFSADGRLEVAGKFHARALFLSPKVYFRARLLPVLTAPNTLSVRFERIDVDKAYGLHLPGFLSNWLQEKLLSSIVGTLTTDPDLSKVIKARRLDEKTMEIDLADSAFLPSFADGAVIHRMTLGEGLLYLAFKL